MLNIYNNKYKNMLNNMFTTLYSIFEQNYGICVWTRHTRWVVLSVCDKGEFSMLWYGGT